MRMPPGEREQFYAESLISVSNWLELDEDAPTVDLQQLDDVPKHVELTKKE